MAYPNYGNPYMNNPYGMNMNTQMNPNYSSSNQNQLMYGNQSNQQNDGSLMTVFVQGEAGANAYPVASGNTVLLIHGQNGCKT